MDDEALTYVKSIDHELARSFLVGRNTTPTLTERQAPQTAKAVAQHATGPSTSEELLKVAYLLGRLCRLAVTIRKASGVADAYSTLAMCMRQSSSIHSSIKLGWASAILHSSAKDMERANSQREQLILLSNRLVIRLEYPNYTTEELQAMHQEALELYQLKDPSLEDRFYSLHTIALIELKLPYRRNEEIPRLIKAKKVMRKSMMRLRSELSSDQLALCLAELAVAEMRIRSALRREGISRSIAVNRDRLPVHLVDRADLNPYELGSAIMSNPQAFGFSEPPVWIGNDPYTISRLGSRRSEVNRSVTELQDALDRLELASHTAHYCALTKAQLHWDSYPDEGSLADYLAVFEMQWYNENPADLCVALSTALFSGFARLGVEPQGRQLQRVAAAINMVFDSVGAEILFDFVRYNPVMARFVSVQLARADLWEASYALLENTRGRVFGQRQTASMAQTSDSTVVHLTHDPSCSVAIIKHADGKIDGAVFPELAGRFLVQDSYKLWPSARALDPTISQRSKAVALNELVNRIAPAIKQVVTHAGSPRSILLCPGGLYAAMPVWALCIDYVPPGTIVSIAVSDRATKEHASDTGRIPQPIQSLATLDATSIPGLELPFAHEEISMIDRTTGIHSEARLRATRESTLRALRTFDVVHFAGHARVEPADPLASELILHDGTLSARDLYEADGFTSRLVVLNACESGLASTSSWQDELISVQGALLASGCSMTIGSLWPVKDVSAAVYFAYFYWVVLNDERELQPQVVCQAMQSCQVWMRSTPGGVIKAFLLERGASHRVIAASPAFANEDLNPFAHPVHWAPYYLSVKGV